MKIVLDTKVADRRLVWCVSPPILAEYQAVPRRPKFSKISGASITALLNLSNRARMFAPSVRLKMSPDAADNRFYECAFAAQADFLVTGNQRHFPVGLPPTRVVNARQLLRALEN